MCTEREQEVLSKREKREVKNMRVAGQSKLRQSLYNAAEGLGLFICSPYTC